jgi:anaphase-promoting complex subunit 12
MIRRNPTRIELKIEDIAEYEQLKRDMDAQRASIKHNLLGSSPVEAAATPHVAPAPNRPDKETIHNRIGYDPKPKLQ